MIFQFASVVLCCFDPAPLEYRPDGFITSSSPSLRAAPLETYSSTQSLKFSFLLDTNCKSCAHITIKFANNLPWNCCIFLHFSTLTKLKRNSDRKNSIFLHLRCSVAGCLFNYFMVAVNCCVCPLLRHLKSIFQNNSRCVGFRILLFVYGFIILLKYKRSGSEIRVFVL